MRTFTLLFALFSTQISLAQIVTTDPPLPTANDVVTITYDATQGTGQLAGITPVYIHTGVITDVSAPGEWRYVVGNWGVADPTLEMVDIGNNLHQMTFHIRDFYGVPDSEEILEMAFVFRNANGSLEGKTEDWMDIFVPVYSDGAFSVSFTNPTETTFFVNPNETIPITATASASANFLLYIDDILIYQAAGTELNYNLQAGVSGTHEVRVTAEADGITAEDVFNYTINPNVNIEAVPTDAKLGLNELNDNTLRLVLYAPMKEFVYVIGDFNNWTAQADYFMNRSPDGAYWWLDITGLNPQTEYAFQYLVDGNIRIADPFSEKILDPFHDAEIAVTYPDLKPYPTGETTNAVTAFTLAEETYDWQVNNFEKPAKTDLVIYELLMRDFLETRNYNTLIDTLDYLENLGINAIELMPVSEFEGNQSWGYNPSFHNALDKYYGDTETFKRFIDEAHSRGMAVILDVVFNHAFSQSPLCQLYWDAANFRPSPENPYLNVTAKHPYNVGYDFDHESVATQAWVDRVMRHWIHEFRVDGFRFDLSKGITQNFNTDVGAWSAYDASRIALLKRMADVCWAEDADFYVILEHFAENAEEIELSDYGCMLWGNENYQYNEATMGYNSDLTNISYQNRTWSDPHLIGYMESHDEERMMYKNLEYGNSAGNYTVQERSTALARQELAAAFFFTVPGPKLMWQFGELGYDYSINHCTDGTVNNNCRLDPKPVRWDYLQMTNRRRLYDVYKALIDLKKNHTTFKTTDYQLDVSGSHKQIYLNDDEMNAVVLGNFDVEAGDLNVFFQDMGMWYEYFSGDSLMVDDLTEIVSLDAGEYRLYTDKKLDTPDVVTNINYVDNSPNINLHIFPNPASSITQIEYELPQAADVKIRLINSLGQPTETLRDEQQTSGTHYLNLLTSRLKSGLYFVEIEVNNQKNIKKLRVCR